MRLRSIQIENFKSLESVHLDDCGPINAIIGKNNSGKSSVLHAIDMAGLALSLNRWDRFQPKLDIKDLFANVGEFSLTLGFDDGAELQLTSNPQYGPSMQPQPTEKQRLKTVLVLPDVGMGMLRRQHRTPRNVIDQVENRNFLDINALEILYAIKFYATRGERNLNPASYRAILDEIKSYFPDIEDVESDRTEQDIATLTYSEYGHRFDILYSGTGLKHFLDVLLKTTISNADIVLLDEPELGLHPDLQRRFVEYLVKLASDKGVQIFLATHSQVLLNYADELNYFRITNTSGKRQLIRVEKDAIDGLLSDLGLRPSDVLNQDICVLVEGATDVVFMEHVLRVLYAEDFKGVAVSVIQYGGGAAEGIISGDIKVGNIVQAQRNTLWIRDRDAKPDDQPSPNATRFANALIKQGLEAHVWKRREIEFYFPETVHIAAQQGNPDKENATQSILLGTQERKYRTLAAECGVCVPTGKYLRQLLGVHLTTRDQLDPEIRELVEGTLLPWRNQVLGKDVQHL